MKTIDWSSLPSFKRDALIAEVYNQTPISETYSVVSDDNALWDCGWSSYESAVERGANYTHQTGVLCKVHTTKRYKNYSTDVDFCLELIKDLIEEDISLSLADDGTWFCYIISKDKTESAFASKPSEAIVICALRLKGYEVNL